MMYVMYQDKKKEWHWRIIASTGRIIATSSESYKNEQPAGDLSGPAKRRGAHRQRIMS